MENKVISTEYVKKNFIEKKKLQKFLRNEFEMIRKNRNKIHTNTLDGMESAYKAIQSRFLGDYNE